MAQDGLEGRTITQCLLSLLGRGCGVDGAAEWVTIVSVIYLQQDNHNTFLLPRVVTALGGEGWEWFVFLISCFSYT